MGSTQRRISRRTILTFIFSFIFGFHLTSWIAIQPPRVDVDRLRRADYGINLHSDCHDNIEQQQNSAKNLRMKEPFYAVVASQRKAQSEQVDYIDPELNRNQIEGIPLLPQYKFMVGPQSNSQQIPKQEGFLYVGVMTAGKYLESRCRAILDTWKHLIPGKVEFYVGENARTNSFIEKLPLRRLATVDDNAYPPQKKSFLLLKSMYDLYLNSGYEWFMRADDDIYIKGKELERLLRRLNSSEPIVLGQTGIGNDQERGQLGLERDENYCMGGPGVIMSREIIRRVGPHIHKCVKQLYTWHEDVELSRCLKRFANVNCPWTYEVQDLFYEHYANRKGYIDAYDEAQNRRLAGSLTMHPNKNPFYQLKLHQYVLSKKIETYRKLALKLTREAATFSKMLNLSLDLEKLTVGSKPSFYRFAPKNWKEVIPWDMLTDRLVYSAPPSIPRRGIQSPQQYALRKIILNVLDTMNNNPKAAGRKAEFKQISYGYKRVNPLYGAEYVLDLILTYKRKRGKKMVMQMRRHVYMIQCFSRVNIKEEHDLNVEYLKNNSHFRRHFLALVIQKTKNMFLSMIGVSTEDMNNWQVFKKNHVQRRLHAARTGSDKNTLSPYVYGRKSPEVINIIVPLIGRFTTFQIFMKNLEQICLSTGDAISLLVILFHKNDPSLIEDGKRTIELVSLYQQKYPKYDLKLIQIEADFSRGAGLEVGASHFANNSLLFFCDVDVYFNSQFLRKCRHNTIHTKQVYYPILYSEFFPGFTRVKTEWQRKGNLTAEALAAGLKQALEEEIQARRNHYAIYKRAGYWRSYGFGLLCVYQDDFVSSGGFDTSIRGWGLEDVDLVDKFLNQPAVKNQPIVDHVIRTRYGDNVDKIELMRAVDPSLIHVYHPSHCDAKLPENQLRMCAASRASTIAHVYDLSDAWMLKEFEKTKRGLG